jgi:hypothetical protein
MPIETIERFYCNLCGFITSYKPVLEQIKKTGICPACQNGKNKGWTYKGKTVHKCIAHLSMSYLPKYIKG